ncbi:MAG: enoyl-CoA hydratase-related protein [Acidimicrobiia bacterium]|nr:enoyl-CoA hydratase-related protein [Acidimicrobiia bacterium]
MCCGAGLGLALACDVVLAGESARFSMIFVERGLTPDGNTTWLVARSAGAQRAKDPADDRPLRRRRRSGTPRPAP